QEEPWGFKLRRLRTAAGMTQEALASQLGVSQSQISQFERKKNPPKSNILEKLKTIFPEI
ncbi:MAG: helix-turn-helix domain-containing protein, partial [Candidatus Kryptoniota bacterium]